MKADAEKFVQTGHYELLMEAKDSGEIVRMYSVGTETIVNGFVMIADEGTETTFIYLDGKMNRDDLEQIIAERIKEYTKDKWHVALRQSMNHKRHQHGKKAQGGQTGNNSGTDCYCGKCPFCFTGRHFVCLDIVAHAISVHKELDITFPYGMVDESHIVNV